MKSIRLLQSFIANAGAPEAPTRDTDGHDDVEYHLGKENEEEREEVERAVTPVEKEREREIKLGIFQDATLFFPQI